MRILDELNPAQRKAAEHREGPLLIVAGAGAGKTKTITYRILNLLHHGVRADNILAITFTNKAASEMAERVRTLLSEPGEAHPFMSTFHALGVRILRESGEAISIRRDFSILDRSDQMALVKRALAEHDLDPKQHEPKRYLSLISKEKNNLKYPDDISQQSYHTQFVGTVWNTYERLKKDRNVLDFDDLITETARLLRDNREVRRKYQKRWHYIHIDEYQDTNTAQYLISRLLAEQTRNICVVGDGDQNIYSWRGADMRNILNFEKDYPDATVILLEENYRSTKTILSAANSVITKNTVRIEKNLFTRNEQGEPISVFCAGTESDEARYVAERIHALLKDGAEPRDIAVLYRANYQSRALEDGLLRASIPYQVLGIKFFERKEVKDVLSYLRAALNPNNTIDLVRIINTPLRGIGKVTVEKVIAGQHDTLPPKMRERVSSFFFILESIADFSRNHLPSENVRYALEQSGIEAHYRSTNTPEDTERLENVRELVSLAAKYDAYGPEEGMARFLEEAALATDQDSLEHQPANAVRLMTVHAAKGLEFPYVFITGLEEGLFPHTGFDESHTGNVRNEEERRLFYVAVTRAKKRLFLTYANTRTIFGSTQYNNPSTFLQDIDESCLIDETPDREPPSRIVYLEL